MLGATTREVELAAESASPEVSPVADDRKLLRPPGPSEAQRFMADRAGAREVLEIADTSHAVPASRAEEIADVIFAATAHVEQLAHNQPAR